MEDENTSYSIKGSSILYKLVSIDKNIATLKNKNITVKTDVSNITKVENMINVKRESRGFHINISSAPPENEIMLRHLTRLQALDELDRFIDKALLHHLPQVRIIHGRHGTVLRNSVREYLASHPNVASYEYADISCGSTGVTVATLKYK